MTRAEQHAQVLDTLLATTPARVSIELLTAADLLREMQAAIEAAPHADVCDHELSYGADRCNCWKAPFMKEVKK